MDRKIKTYQVQDWIDEGNILFGLKVEKWKFVCPMCKHVQSHEDFEKRTNLKGEGVFKVLGFSCIGRFLTNQRPEKIKGNKFPMKFIGGGCDWTLGGLFNLHNVEVLNKDGKIEPIFEFFKGGKGGAKVEAARGRKNQVGEVERSEERGKEKQE